MDDLIARLEAAPVGSRELSDEVLKACGWHHKVDRRLPDREQWGWLAPAGWRGREKPTLVFGDPDPTRSLDDVMMLVPAGYHVSLEFDTPEPGCDTAATASLFYVERICGAAHRHPAPALCIALLKALAATEGNER